MEFNAEGVGEQEVTEIGAPQAPNQIVFNLAGATAKVSQPNVSNLQTAKNQCAPMAVANSLQYLEDRYKIAIPNDHKKGLNGDDSLVGQLDKKMKRKAGGDTGTDREKGDPVSYKAVLRGKFDYLASNGLSKNLVHKHQGDALDPGDFTAHRITSKNESKNGQVTLGVDL